MFVLDKFNLIYLIQVKRIHTRTKLSLFEPHHLRRQSLATIRRWHYFLNRPTFSYDRSKVSAATVGAQLLPDRRGCVF